MEGSVRHTISEQTREKMRQAKLGHTVSLETRDKIRRVQLGHSVSPQTREKMRRSQLGKSLSPERREKMLEVARRPERREKIRQSKLGVARPPRVIEKLRQALLSKAKTPEHREKLRQARLRQTLPIKMTSIERLLRDEFKKRRLKFEMHKTMFGRFQPDFVFEQANLIVQADGDYWHSRPDRREQDARFNTAAAADDWSVWRFGEREIKMHAAACARAVARFVRDRQG